MVRDGAFTSALELAEAVRSGELGATDVVAAALDRVATLDPVLHAFCRVDRDEALARAAEVDATPVGERTAPFAGVPTACKDLHPELGKPLCSASNGVAHPVMEADSPAIAALRAAGLVSVGATVSPEFGALSVTESPRHVVTVNPWDQDKTCGGSSGGAAVAVASGMLPIAHGSDGAGSIREPAGYCGLVGMKPSRGRVPTHNIAWASEGVLTRTVGDTAAALDVFAGAPPVTWYRQPDRPVSFLDASRRDPRRLRVAVSTRPAFPVEVEPVARTVTKQAADLLADLGHEVVERDVPGLDPEVLQEPFETYWSCISAGHEVTDPVALEPLNKYLRDRARETGMLTFVAAQGELVKAGVPMYELWHDVDVLLTPTTARAAPPVGHLWRGLTDDPLGVLRRVEELAAMTVPANLLGLPAISIPLVPPEDTVPLGVQLMGGPQGDAVVLALAGQLERARPWADRRPPTVPAGARE